MGRRRVYPQGWSFRQAHSLERRGQTSMEEVRPRWLDHIARMPCVRSECLRGREQTRCVIASLVPERATSAGVGQHAHHGCCIGRVVCERVYVCVAETSFHRLHSRRVALCVAIYQCTVCAESVTMSCTGYSADEKHFKFEFPSCA